MERYVLLDRDGTLTADRGYTHRIEDYELLPGVVEGLRTLAEAGFRLAIVTNQSGIGRGYYEQADYERFQQHLCADLARQGVQIDASFHCPHRPEEGCSCRKPQPGLLLRARDALGIDLERSWLIGDSDRDLGAAASAGCRGSVLLLTGEGASADARVGAEVPRASDLPAAARAILDAELGETSTRPPAIAYLMSRYPAISHTFIFREIQSMRAQGIEVATASVNTAQDLERMTPAEQAEADETLYIKSRSIFAIAGAHARMLLRNPLAWLRMALGTATLMTRPHASAWKLFGYFVEAAVVLDWMRERELSHLHVHFGGPVASVALVAAQAGTIEFSLSVHGPDVFYGVAQHLLEDKIRTARFVRCISHYCRSQLMMCVPAEQWDKLHVVRCGVDLAVFSPRKDPDNEVPQLLCVGRLVPAKGQHILLRACRQLVDRGVPFELTLVGDGPDRDSLECEAAALELTGRLTFTGAIGQDRVHEHYDRADVVVLASFAEGLPAGLYEPMAKAIPCVSTRIAGHPEIIEDSVNGYLVSASDPRALADRLERLLGDAELRVELGRRSREKVEAEYDLERNYPRLAALFAEVAASGSRKLGS